jgi:hypothetical protein
MKPFLRNSLAASTLGLTLTISALALAGKDNPCKADVARLCPNVEPGGGRIIRCLKDHEADLSDACKAAFQRGKK